MGGDDGAVAAGQEVQEGGFADVGGAGDDDAGAVAQDVALVPGVQQGLDFAGNGRQTAANLVWNRLRQFIIRKIEHGLDIGRNGEQGVVKSADPAAEGVFELGCCEPRGAFGTGLDEVEDGLGLGQVDLSIQKGALGEFAGVGLARAGGEEGVEDAPGGLRAAVALDFDRILAGVGMRRAEHEPERVVEDFAGAGRDGRAVRERAGGPRGERRRRAAVQAVGQRERAGARKADDGDGACARRGGDRGDDVGWRKIGHVCGVIHRNGAGRNLWTWTARGFCPPAGLPFWSWIGRMRTWTNATIKECGSTCAKSARWTC